MADRNGAVSGSAHYEALLADVYGWSFGGLASGVEANIELFQGMGLRGQEGRALDLGAGNGAQSLALLGMGWDVVALDTSDQLLRELVGAVEVFAGSGALSRLTTHVADMTEPGTWDHDPFDLVLCMGDTLPHLPTLADVETVVDRAADCLTPGGELVLTFRDYSGPGPQGSGRVIPVRSDENRILTCVLAYRDDVVEVTDVLHEREGEQWTMRASTYQKLRLDPESVRTGLEARGLQVELGPGPRGMVLIRGRKRS